MWWALSHRKQGLALTSCEHLPSTEAQGLQGLPTSTTTQARFPLGVHHVRALT